MGRAGFYAIPTVKLSFRSDGRWYAGDEPVVHERLARFFSRYLRRKAAGGYEIWIDERYHADVDIEDTPFVVVGVHGDAERGFTIELNDGTAEALAPETLRIGAGDALTCRVKGNERARFLRPAYYQLAAFIEQAATGRFELRCGDHRYAIR